MFPGMGGDFPGIQVHVFFLLLALVPDVTMATVNCHWRLSFSMQIVCWTDLWSTHIVNVKLQVVWMALWQPSPIHTVSATQHGEEILAFRSSVLKDKQDQIT
jgi:hypothetical protein